MDIKVPQFPESVADGTIVTWHHRPGESVRRNENLVDIETDKVVFEVPAPADGRLTEIAQPEGATVTSGQVIGRLETGSAAAAETGAATAGEAGPASMAPGPQATPAVPVRATPSARRLIEEHGLDPAHIEPTGRDGRLLKEDVLRYLDGQAEASPPPPPPVAATPEAAGETAGPPGADPWNRPQKRVPMSRLRQRIAERLVEAQHTAAMLTTFNEVDMQAVIELRQRHREAFEQRHGVKLGFVSFFVRAVVEALKQFPAINAAIDGTDILYHGFFDIGIAVGSPRGLVVPILRDADRMSMADIEKAIADFAAKARDGRLGLEELTGGTFTITNGGIFGSLLSTPILNPPQSGILGMHRIEQRAVVRDGAIVIRPMMYLALTYDHRIVDGREAVQFLVAVKAAIEDPARLLLEV